MRKENVHKVGLVFGGLFGVLHACWALLVAFGVAQGLMDFIFAMHMLNPIMIVAPFSLWTALMLIVATSIIGYIVGVVFGWLWNKLAVTQQ